MTKDEMITLAQAQLDAYNQRNIENFCEYFHTDIVCMSLPQQNVLCEGMAAFKKSYGEFFAANPQLYCELKNRVVLGETVLDEEWVTGHPRNPAGVHTVAIYAFRDGKIDRVWFAR